MMRRKKAVERSASVDVPKGQIKKTVGLAVRIHEGRHASKEIKASLRKLGLKEKYDAVFVKLDSAGIGECFRRAFLLLRLRSSMIHFHIATY